MSRNKQDEDDFYGIMVVIGIGAALYAIWGIIYLVLINTSYGCSIMGWCS